MTSYKKLYFSIVRSADEALNCLDAGKIMQAQRILQKTLLHAEETVTEQDIIPEEDWLEEK